MQEQNFSCNIGINKRAQKILKLLVDCYIREGQPVSSKFLAQASELNISAASVRNIMADLEDAGLIHAPHTSAGRIPTIKGYRFFVNELINVRSLPEFGAMDVEDKLRLSSCSGTKELITGASSLLSEMTHLTSLVMLPCREAAVLRHIEFLPLSGNRILVILVLQKSEVQNRIIYTDRCYSPSELQTIGNYLTANFAGKELSEIRQLLVAAMKNDQDQIAHLTQEIIDMTSQAFVNNENPDYVVAGETNLLTAQDQIAIHQLRDLFVAFAAKRDILHLLGQCLHASGVRIYIGEESGYAPLNDCSLVVSPYSEGDKVVGVVGVIGPTRMAYDKAIAAVDITARLLGTALGELE